jgi:hypothetical protein
MSISLSIYSFYCVISFFEATAEKDDTSESIVGSVVKILLSL